MKNTILIIEDSSDVRENVSELLTLAGYITLTAENGKRGLELAISKSPDLILCDIMLPELDGYGVLKAIESNSSLSDIPFVYLTAKSKRSDFRKGMDLGADDYLTKPFTGDELLRIVSTRLRKKSNNMQIHNRISGPDDINENNSSIHDIVSLSKNKINKKYRKKDIIFMEGDAANSLYYIQSGKVKIFKTNQFEKEYILEIHKGGEFFGYHTLFNDGVHKESAIAIENSEIIIIPKQEFYDNLVTNGRLTMEFIKRLSGNYIEAEEKLLQLAYNSARKRVAEALLFVSKKFNPEMSTDSTFSLQRENISAIAGISPESVSRNLTEFKEEGLIRTENGCITILDYKKLESLKN